MKTKNFILFLLMILLIISFSSCNKNCEHEFVNKSFLTQPTCETQGEVLMKCKKCKLEETKVLNALGHDYVYETIVEPSCHNTGLKKGVCRRNPSHEDEVILDKLPHNFINYIDDNNASFKQNGTKTAKCENEGCNAIDVVEISNSMYPDFNNDTFFYDLLNDVLDNNFSINLDNCKIVDDILVTDSFTLSLSIDENSNSFIGNGSYNEFDFALFDNIVYVNENNNYLYKIPVENVKVNDKSLSGVLSMLDSTYLKGYNFLKQYVNRWKNLVNNLSKNLIFDIFDIEKDENGYIFTLNIDFLKKFNEEVSKMRVLDFSNKYLLGNIVSKLHRNIKELLSENVKELLESDEYDIIEILSLIDEVIVLLTKGKYDNLEQYLKEEKNIEVFDLDNIFVDEKYQNYTVLDAISEISNISTTAILLSLNTSFLNVESKKVYEFLGSFVKLDNEQLYTIINDLILKLENSFSLKINVSLDRKLQGINITYDDSININIYKNEASFNYELVNYVNTYIHDLYSDRGFLAINFVEEFEKNYDEDSFGLDFIEKTVIDSFTTTFESTNEKGDKYSFEKHYTVTRYEFDDLSAIKYDILENKYYLIFSKATESDLFAMGNVYYSEEKGYFNETIICGYEFEVIELYNQEVQFVYR